MENDHRVPNESTDYDGMDSQWYYSWLADECC